MKDKVFDKPIEKQFEFDDEVAAVFDDMLTRSVPFYKESQEISKYFARRALREDGVIYDLGCSTASSLLNIERDLEKKARLIGIDNAAAMLDQARKKCDVYGSNIELVQGDILTYKYEMADVMLSNYTLQFIRPPVRNSLVQTISSALNEKGVFIFSEKVISENSTLNKALIDCYYEFKKEQGYSSYEIMQKREALENVLIPYTEKENIEMCLAAGFRHCEVICRWSNFATFIAMK